MNGYHRPQSLKQALAEMASGPKRLLAGGTDIFPGAGRSLPGEILDISDVSEMRGISLTADGLRIGGATTWAEIACANLHPALRSLQQAARQVGSAQVQNMGTLAGNLCNASPAADGVPPLLTLDASVELAGPTAVRTLPLSDFLIGPRKTARGQDEILTAIVIPDAALNGQSAFLKLGARAYLVISIAMVAAKITVLNGRISSAAIAVGSCSAAARRLTDAEGTLLGCSTAEWRTALRPDAISSALTPIDDVRASAGYRSEAAIELVARAVDAALPGERA